LPTARRAARWPLNASATVLWQAKGKASFCEQKETKKLFYAGPWAVSATTPMAQHKKSFCAAFFKKRLLSSTFLLVTIPRFFELLY
jgi:hypothetical protein